MTGRNGIAIAILAGGKGSRIGGGKPELRLAGRKLIDRAIEQARGWSDRIVVSLRSPNQAGPLATPCIADAPDVGGPLAGLAAGLAWARDWGADGLLTIPCDMPFLPADLASRLMSAIGEHGAAVAASGGRLNPVCALWRTSGIDEISAYLETGRRSLHGFAAQVGYVEVDWPAATPDPFFNINTKADLAEAERLFGD